MILGKSRSTAKNLIKFSSKNSIIPIIYKNLLLMNLIIYTNGAKKCFGRMWGFHKLGDWMNSIKKNLNHSNLKLALISSN